jgi:hypothetical protein
VNLYVEKGLNFGPTYDLILHHENSPAHKALKTQKAPKCVIETEYTPCSPVMDSNDFWLFRKISLPYRYEDFKIMNTLKFLKKCADSTESYSTTGVPKMFPVEAVEFG